MNNKPLIVHSDRKIYLIEKLDSEYVVEDELNAYATLIRTPANVHTYCLDEFSLWSASVLGVREDTIIQFLQNNSKNILPERIVKYIKDTIKDFWTMELHVGKDCFKLEGNSKAIDKVVDIKDIKSKILIQNKSIVIFDKKDFYNIRKILLKQNVYLIEKNDRFARCNLKIKHNVTLYKYQKKAVEKFINTKNEKIYGRGVITMPPGSGKTIVALKIIEIMKVNTLILIKSKDEYNQWLNEIKDKTNFDERYVAYNEFQADKPICICTYKHVAGELDDGNIESPWGLIIYDDANSLPAQKSSKTAYITSKYKLAMDSILWRSDHNESLIFKTIGPKIFNLTLKKLEQNCYQIKVKCYEVKIPFQSWDIKEEKNSNHTASKNANKIEAYRLIQNRHENEQKILVSHFIKVSKKFSETFDIDLCDGNSDYDFREKVIEIFNNKKIDSISFTDIFENQILKNIDVLVALSYHGKSAREEYLRIGKLKSSNEERRIIGYYYALVSENTEEEKIYIERRNKMLKYGYDFKIITLDELRRRSSEI